MSMIEQDDTLCPFRTYRTEDGKEQMMPCEVDCAARCGNGKERGETGYKFVCMRLIDVPFSRLKGFNG